MKRTIEKPNECRIFLSAFAWKVFNEPYEHSHLTRFELRPYLEQEENPTPGLLTSWFYPPPSDAGEDKVEAQGRDDHGEAVPVALVERLQQGDVVVDVQTRHRDVEE